MYGARSEEFIEGVIAGLKAFAWWRGGTEWIGSPEKMLIEAIKEAKEGLGG